MPLVVGVLNTSPMENMTSETHGLDSLILILLSIYFLFNFNSSSSDFIVFPPFLITIPVLILNSGPMSPVHKLVKLAK